ncbi:MAG: hypothetical protein ACPL25_07250 [Ignavibacteria bacterium]
MKNKRLKVFKFTAISIVILALVFGFTSIDKSGDKSSGQRLNKVVGAYYMTINNLEMPLNNAGVFADVTIPPKTSGGKFDGHTFLFSGGFAMSGYIDIGQPTEFLWANGVATASRIQDYRPGPVGSDPADPKNKLYIVRSDEEPFSASWQEWKDAVSLGADFYDGDNDGKYNPVDKNGNGQWDPDEDRPDLLGDETVWCVINDGVPAGDRRYTDVNPLGIEIHQTVFGFASSGLLGNMLFVRYKVINKNPDGKTFDSVYFSVWADPDLGDYTDDLVGCDVPASASGYAKTPSEGRNAGYVYNQGSDNEYGPNPPTYLVDFFQGPFVYTGNTADTAYNVRGPILGVDTLVGYKQLGISSFLQYFQSQPVEQADPANRIELRYYTLGFNRQGKPLNPCTWQFGSVVGGVNCSSVDPRFFYSGDPHRNIGWIQTTQADERMMVNTGKFRLRPMQDTAIIVAALIVGRGTSATSSIEEAKRISDFAQFIYDQNFRAASAPPAPKVTIRTTENSIDLMWPTYEQVNFKQKTIAYDQRFEGFELWAFRTNSTADYVAGVENAKVIARWDLKNNIENVLQEDSKTGERKTVYYKGIQLDSTVYGNPQTGFIKYSITTDPWTGGPIVKGKPYYFAVISYALNHDALIPVDPTKPVGNYYISGAAFVGASANVKKILQGGIIPGQDLNDPYVLKSDINLQGVSEASAYFEEIDKTKLTGHEYEISFFRNTDSTNYFMNWRLVDKTTNDTLVKSSNKYDNLVSEDDKYTIPVVDGFIPRVTWVPAKIKPAQKSASMTWVRNERATFTGVFYMGKDIPALSISPFSTLGAQKHDLVTADKLAQIEIRFQPGKAYRFVSNTLGTAYTSAAGTTSGIGKPGEYFVDVPFQVWKKDARKGIEQRLACAFVESRTTGGNPDGVWDPDTAIDKTREYILIFDQPYDENGQQMEYVGYLPTTGTKTYANLNGWNPPASANFTPEQIDRAKAKWLGAIYVVGFEKNETSATWSSNDVYTIPVSYPLTTNDKFVFRTTKAGAGVTQDYKKSLMDRVTVYPNPLYAYNPTVGYYSDPNNPKNDEPFVTFSNLPTEVTIKIYTLSGQLLKVLTKNDPRPFMNWDLKNKDGLRAASGVYLAVVSSPGLGEKVLKFSIIQPQKQIKRF